MDGRDYESDQSDHPTSCDEGEPFALDFRDGQTPLLTLCGEEDLADIAGIWSQTDLDIEVQRAAEVRPSFDENWAIQVEGDLWIYGAPGSDEPETNVVDIFGNLSVRDSLTVGADNKAVTVWVMEGEGPPEEIGRAHV